MLIDYKIVSLVHVGRHVSVRVRIYRGAISLVVSSSVFESLPSSQYVRNVVLRDRTFEYDLTRDMTTDEVLRKAQFLLNKRLSDWAFANGHVVILEEQDTTGYETPSNETEYASA